MWIRSQDKRIFKNVDDIRLDTMNVIKENQERKIYVIVWDSWQCYFERCLGEYTTEEKALKVLDMIQEHIKNMYIGTGNYMGKPFQMPQDKEVE